MVIILSSFCTSSIGRRRDARSEAAVTARCAEGPLTSGLLPAARMLTATSSVLAVSFLDQALEYQELRQQVRDLIGGHAWPQLILRIGYPAEAQTATGRIPWRDTLDRRF